MTPFARFPQVLFLTAILGLPCAAQVRDDAGLFTPETVRDAQSRLQRIRERTGKQVAVWTLKEAPAEVASTIKADDAKQRNQVFENLAQERIKDLKLHGVHLLICQSPRHIQVSESLDREEFLGPAQQKQLRGRMIRAFQPDNPDRHAHPSIRIAPSAKPRPDEGLIQSLKYLEAKLDPDPRGGPIRDEAKLFNEKTLQEGLGRIDTIFDLNEKEVVIRTIKELPEELTKKYNLRDAGHLEELFGNLAREEMKAEKIQGVHLLVSTVPQHIQITVSEDSDHLFGKWYREHLKGRMIGKFQPDSSDQNVLRKVRNKMRSANPNEGLIESLDYVALKLDYNRPIDHTNFKLGSVAIGGLLGLGAILGVLRSRLRQTTPADAGVHDVEDSGRSIAVLGGGIGAVTGLWISNKLFGPRAPSEPVAAETPPPAEELPPDEEQGPDAVPGVE
jgi:hypothetical protein